MSFTTPLLLLALLPWGAVAVWMCRGVPRRGAVPFLPFWDTGDALDRPQRKWVWPAGWVALLLAAAACGIVAGAGPVTATRQGPPIVVILDLGLATGTPARRDALAGDLLAGLGDLRGRATLITLPDLRTRVVPFDRLRSTIADLPVTAVDTSATLRQVVRTQTSRSPATIYVLTADTADTADTAETAEPTDTTDRAAIEPAQTHGAQTRGGATETAEMDAGGTSGSAPVASAGLDAGRFSTAPDAAGRVVVLRPPATRDVEISLFSIRTGSPPQAMVRLSNRSTVPWPTEDAFAVAQSPATGPIAGGRSDDHPGTARQTVTLRIDSAGRSTRRVVALPPAGATRDEFVDLPAAGAFARATLEGLSDDIPATDTAWLARRPGWPAVAAVGTVPASVGRVIDIYRRLRPGRAGAVRVAVAGGIGQLPTTGPALALGGPARAAGRPAPTTGAPRQAADESPATPAHANSPPDTRRSEAPPGADAPHARAGSGATGPAAGPIRIDVDAGFATDIDWSRVLRDARVAGEPPSDWRPVVTAGGRTLVAVRDVPPPDAGPTAARVNGGRPDDVRTTDRTVEQGPVEEAPADQEPGNQAAGNLTEAEREPGDQAPADADSAVSRPPRDGRTDGSSARPVPLDSQTPPPPAGPAQVVWTGGSRQILVNFDSADWPTRPDYILFFVRAFDWLGRGDTGPEIDPADLPPDAARPGDAYTADPPTAFGTGQGVQPDQSTQTARGPRSARETQTGRGKQAGRGTQAGQWTQLVPPDAPEAPTDSADSRSSPGLYRAADGSIRAVSVAAARQAGADADDAAAGDDARREPGALAAQESHAADARKALDARNPPDAPDAPAPARPAPLFHSWAAQVSLMALLLLACAGVARSRTIGRAPASIRGSAGSNGH